ncbi:glycosyltransferase family 2 protein [Pararcticibacter amylolyticus]|uniref:Glycosyl transferase n=1 Tax=Pararcticibacter amylolyticus TaxID=2173175 RepID=A0A2U2PJ21_9SPHI|nr:glycosyltransferase family 2 protein [Pararcticibacter amylolyticus]PWG81159.1 glycosyl transferase [Pararcticibacter amylolyticus]
MKVTIITVTYNSERFLKSCIDSVVSQNYPDIEYIIIDGGSTDGTADIVASYGEKISCYKSEKDDGIYYAMNKGIRLATGHIVGFLNSDDFYVDNNVIATVVGKFSSQDICCTYADLLYIDQDDKKIVRRWIAGSYLKRAFKFGWMPPHPTFYVRTDLLLKYGAFNTNFKTSADYELMLRLLFRYSIKPSYIPKAIVKMRVGGQSNSSFRNRIRANREDLLAWKVNNLKPFFFTIILKPIRKILQYF